MSASNIVLGDFRITLIREAIHWWDGGVLFGVVPKTLWSRHVEPDELNRIPLGFNCYLIETGDHTVLVETGAGDKPDRRARERMKLPEDAPPLVEVLAAARFDPGRIDIVINTHLHWDHCGGNTVLAGDAARPAFPAARYYVQRREWEHAHERHPRDSVSYVDANYDPLVEAGRMCLLDGDAEIVPGIRPNMMVVTAESRGETFCFFSDLVPTAAHVTPTWVAAFDLAPVQTIDNKFRLLGQAARAGWVCGFGHDPDIAFARIAGRRERGAFCSTSSSCSSESRCALSQHRLSSSPADSVWRPFFTSSASAM